MEQQKRIMMITGGIALIVLVIVAVTFVTPSQPSVPTDQETTNEPNQPTEPRMDTLGIETLQQGSGPAAQIGNTVSVHYTGTLTDGSVFDSSLTRGTPFSFTLGQRRVIEGWEQGVLGMQVGEKRRLTIPSDLGYGDSGFPPVIPPRATLTFEIELLALQ
jgi:FKBP-type peptidyl-prolyl cis-trans isomerase